MVKNFNLFYVQIIFKDNNTLVILYDMHTGIISEIINTYIVGVKFFACNMTMHV